MTTSISSREFNQHTSEAKKATETGPVFITDRGRPAHVLLTFENYRKLTDKQPSIVELLRMPEGDDIDFEPGRLGDIISRPVDLD